MFGIQATVRRGFSAAENHGKLKDFLENLRKIKVVRGSTHPKARHKMKKIIFYKPNQISKVHEF